MKYKIEIENGIVVGYLTDVCSCYVQSTNPDNISALLKRAHFIYQNSYQDRKENFYPVHEKPVLNVRIKFITISTQQLIKILNKFEYKVETRTHDFILMRNDNLPFNRILIPNVPVLSPIIIKKIFGEHNTTVVKKAIYS